MPRQFSNNRRDSSNPLIRLCSMHRRSEPGQESVESWGILSWQRRMVVIVRALVPSHIFLKERLSKSFDLQLLEQTPRSTRATATGSPLRNPATRKKRRASATETL